MQMPDICITFLNHETTREDGKRVYPCMRGERKRKRKTHFRISIDFDDKTKGCSTAF